MNVFFRENSVVHAVEITLIFVVRTAVYSYVTAGVIGKVLATGERGCPMCGNDLK